MRIRFAILCCVILLSLNACGGSGGGSTLPSNPAPANPPAPPAEPEPEPEPDLATEAELKVQYWNTARERYTGSEAMAEITAQNAQAIFASTTALYLPATPTDVWYLVSVSEAGLYGDPDTDSGLVSVEETVACEAAGSLHFEGELWNGTGVLTVEHQGCSSGSTFPEDGVTGTGAVSLPFGRDDDQADFVSTLFFDRVTSRVQDRSVEISGVYTEEHLGNRSIHDERPWEFDVSYQALFEFPATGTQVLVDLTQTETQIFSEQEHNVYQHAEGVFWVSGVGRVQALRDWKLFIDDDNLRQVVTYTGLNSSRAKISIYDDYVIWLEVDSDGDGVFELGDAFQHSNVDSSEFLNHDFGVNPLGPRDENISYPPSVELRWSDGQEGLEAFAGEALSVIVTVEDPDTNAEELSIQYFWTINGALAEGIDGPSLPQGMTEPGDYILVYAEVSDVFTTVTSNDEIKDIVAAE